MMWLSSSAFCIYLCMSEKTPCVTHWQHKELAIEERRRRYSFVRSKSETNSTKRKKERKVISLRRRNVTAKDFVTGGGDRERERESYPTRHFTQYKRNYPSRN